MYQNDTCAERSIGMGKPRVALQMYTVRDEAAKDFAGTMRKVGQIGYAGAELAGTGGLSAKELKALCDESGLVPVGSHVGIADVTADHLAAQAQAGHESLHQVGELQRRAELLAGPYQAQRLA